MTYETTLTEIISTVTAVDALTVDRDATFPRRSVDALAAAGILAITVPAELGGGGAGLRVAADVVRRLSTACGSTAMVVTMHYTGTAALFAADRADVLKEIVAGHLTSLAFSETGSRSHFWAPQSTAVPEHDLVQLDAQKSWVTSAHAADGYVWSSRPLAAEGPMTLWYVPRETEGLSVTGSFDGLGLRGNDSCPISGQAIRTTTEALVGVDGGGMDLAMAAVLPWFLILNAAAGVGLMEAVTSETRDHLVGTRLEHLDQALSDQPVARAALATMSIETTRTRALVDEAVSAIEAGRPDAALFALQAKAAADLAASSVADAAMTLCGGAAFRKELSVERRFRDSRAARVMAPTTATLLDFIGRVLCGMPLLDAPA